MTSVAQMSKLKIDYMFMCYVLRKDGMCYAKDDMCSTRNCYMIKMICVEREIVICYMTSDMCGS